MKVLLINNCHYRRGGSEAVYFGMAELLQEGGHEVVFLSMAAPKNIQTPNTYLVKNRGGIGKIKNYFYNADAARKLEEVVIKEKPDVAHVHLFWGGFSPSIFSILKKYGIPLAHTAHDYRMVCPAYLLKDGEGRFCERCKGGHFFHCALHKCSKGSLVGSALMSAEMYWRNKNWHPVNEIDKIIFVSEFSRNKHIAFDHRFASAETEVLYNCPGKEVNESLNLLKNTFNSYYLFYGRLSEEKGVTTLIKAFGHYPHLKLLIVGTGPLAMDLKKHCENKGMNNVDFLGYKSGKELYDLVAGAKYVCVPSECYENNPMTIVEAFTLSTPVIGAAIGGISEIVEHKKRGYTFESGNVESLCCAINLSTEVSKEEYENQKKEVHVFAERNFSRKGYLQKLETIYKGLIK